MFLDFMHSDMCCSQNKHEKKRKIKKFQVQKLQMKFNKSLGHFHLVRSPEIDEYPIQWKGGIPTGLFGH